MLLLSPCAKYDELRHEGCQLCAVTVLMPRPPRHFFDAYAADAADADTRFAAAYAMPHAAATPPLRCLISPLPLSVHSADAAMR